MTVKTTAEALEAALTAVAELRVYRDPGAAIDPPGVVLGPPQLRWEGYCAGEPTSARWLVYVVVPAGERALEQLWQLVPQVVDALTGLDTVTVAVANPGSYDSGGTLLPAYTVETEVSL